MDTREKRPQPGKNRRASAEGRPENRRGAAGPKVPQNGIPQNRFRASQNPQSYRNRPPQNPRPRREGQPVHRKKGSPSVVYTDPKPFDGKKLALQLVSVAAVVLAVLFGLSIFFKVDREKATVAGAVKYTREDIWNASGIRDGSNLLTLSDAQISGNIQAKLPYVDRVRVGIKLPDTVHIEIKELEVTYSVEAQDGSWWLMGANGKIVDPITMSEAKTFTQVLGLKIEKPAVGQIAVAWEDKKAEETTPPETTVPETTSQTQIQTVPPVSSGQPGETAIPTLGTVTLTGAEKLGNALTILKSLEGHGIMGQIATVDLTDPSGIELWYGKRYEVNMGNMEQMDKKIGYLKAAVDQMGKHQSGQLDISFTTWPDQVGYTPFA